MIDKSKHGIELKAGRVFKKHASFEKANLEINVARIYAGNGIVKIITPDYSEPIIENDAVIISYPEIKGVSLMGNEDHDITVLLVRDLALFHEIFSQYKEILSSSVVYRDAIASNVVITPFGLVHIDFSSSDRFSHCFDDLALLLHPSWNKTTESERRDMVKFYVSERRRFNQLGLNRILLVHDCMASYSATNREARYISLVNEMKSEGIESKGIESVFSSVDFNYLKVSDFAVFFDFRDMRSRYYREKVWRNHET